MDVAAEVRAEAARRGIAISHLAEAAHITPKTCARKLRGHSGITTTDLWNFAHVLGVNASELVARAEKVDPEREG